MYAVEFSGSQQAFHVSELQEAVDKNFNRYIQLGYVNDYIILHLAETYEEANAICEILMTKRNQKQRSLNL